MDVKDALYSSRQDRGKFAKDSIWKIRNCVCTNVT
ncbi:hypothetical protein M0804_011015 [Polistes exclamans]|nr:hypothetical protein M0804_011015 [Polistes exclamans]